MPDRPLDGPDAVPHAFAEAWNARDPEALAALFDEDAEFVNVVGLWWHDRAAIREAHAYGLRHLFRDSVLRVVRTKVKHLPDSVAVVHARMRLTGQTPVGDVAATGLRHTIFSFVVHRTRDGWRCASAHNTDVVAGAETHVRDASGQLRPADYRGRGRDA